MPAVAMMLDAKKNPGRSRGNEEPEIPTLSILVVQVGSLIEVMLAIITIRSGPAAGVVAIVGLRWSAAALLTIALLPAAWPSARTGRAAVFPLWGTHRVSP